MYTFIVVVSKSADIILSSLAVTLEIDITD